MMVTTIIPTRGRADLLMRRAIPSVLAQTVDDWECRVISDGHDEATFLAMLGLIARDGRFSLTTIPHESVGDGVAAWSVGGAAAFNRGLEEARGRWISYLADDDAYRPGHHAALLAATRGADVIYGQSIIPATGQVYGTRWPPDPYDIVQGAYLARRSIVGRAATVPGGPSWDARWWQDLLGREARFARVEAVVHEYHPAPEHAAYHGAIV